MSLKPQLYTYKLGLIFISLFILFACVPFKKPPPALIRVKKWPPLKRPADMKAFNAALDRSLHYCSRLPADYTFWINNLPYTARELEVDLETLKYCLNQADWQKCLKSHFVLYQARGLKKKEVLFTGYYQPVLHAALSPSKRYRYPIYRLPDEWIKIDLRRFGHDLPAKTLIGMVKGHEVIPFYTRAEIDFAHKLMGKGYELAWVDDPIELFFLHVQGSGILVLPDGQRLYVHYAASNGRPYRSIGRIMREWGLLDDNVNGLRIKEFLRNHPEMMQKVFAFNESYIFFKLVPKGPLGAINEVLVPYYSLATDPSVFPRGAILFVDTEIPKVDEKQHFLGWQPFKTIAFSQDTGGAIKGPGRADIFFGTGPIAEAQACYMAQKGKLYLLVGGKHEK